MVEKEANLDFQAAIGHRILGRGRFRLGTFFRRGVFPLGCLEDLMSWPGGTRNRKPVQKAAETIGFQPLFKMGEPFRKE